MSLLEKEKAAEKERATKINSTADENEKQKLRKEND